MVLYTKTNLYSIDNLIQLKESPLCIPPDGLDSSVIDESIRAFQSLHSSPPASKPRKYVLPSRRHSNHTPGAYPEGQIHFNEALGKPDFETTDSPDISIAEFANRFLQQRNAANIPRRSSMSAHTPAKSGFPPHRNSHDLEGQGDEASFHDNGTGAGVYDDSGWVNVGPRNSRKPSDTSSLLSKIAEKTKRRASSVSDQNPEWDVPNMATTNKMGSFSLNSMNADRQVKEFETWKASMKQNETTNPNFIIKEENNDETSNDENKTKSTSPLPQLSPSESITQSVLLPRPNVLPISPISNPMYLHQPEEHHQDNFTTHAAMNIFDPHYMGTLPSDIPNTARIFHNNNNNNMAPYPPHHLNHQLSPSPGRPMYSGAPVDKYMMYHSPPLQVYQDESSSEFRHIPQMLPQDMIPRSGSQSPQMPYYIPDHVNLGGVNVNLNPNSASFDLRLHDTGVPMPVYPPNDPHKLYQEPPHPPQTLHPDKFHEGLNHITKGPHHHYPVMDQPGWPLPVSPGLLYAHPPLLPVVAPPPMPPYGNNNMNFNFNHPTQSQQGMIPKPPYSASEVNYVNEINFH